MRSRLGALSGVPHAVRALARRPLLTGVGVLTIALGTGAFAAVVTVREALLGRSVVSTAPQDLRVIDERRSGRTSAPIGIDAVPWDRFLAYRASLDDVFDGMAADRFNVFALVTPAGPAAVSGYLVSGNYFQVLGAPPALGSYFAEDDEPSVVLGHALWQREFGGQDVIGRLARVDGSAYTIVGVAPEGFRGTVHGLDGALWVPIRAHRGGGTAGWDGWVTFFGRLRSGVDDATAQRRVDAVATRIPPAEDHTTVRGAVVSPLTGIPPVVRPVLERFMFFMLAMGGAVLLIAAANVAGVLVAMAVARRPEMVVRMALGADRRRLMGRVLTETLLLFAAGATLGLVFGAAATRAVAGVQVPLAFDIAFDLTPGPGALATTVLVAVVIGLIFGLVPAWQASGWDLAAGLKSVVRSGGHPPRGWRAFVGAQVALSAILLVVASLFFRSLATGLAMDPGFDPDGVVIGKVDLAPHGYDVDEARRYFDRLLERVRGLPGVVSAALAETVPLGATYGRNGSQVRVAGVDGAPDQAFTAVFSRVGAGYFASMRTEVVAGHGFEDDPGPGAAPVAVVNETLARRAWPDRSPLGQTFNMDGRSYVVVGVARDGKYGFVGESSQPYVFRSLEQEPGTAATIHVRSTGPEGQTLARLGAAVGALDPDVPLQGGLFMSDLVALTLFPQRFAASFVGVFGLVGLLFAGVGVYGIIAFHAQQRTHEIGIRMVLGADAGDLVWRMTGDSLGSAALWIAAGLALAALVGRAVGGLMIGVSPLDPLTYGGVAVVMLTVAGLAAFLPVRRASRVDPSVALRAE